MSETIIEFFNTFNNPALLSFIPLILSFVIIRFTRINLRNFTAVYLLLAIAHMVFTYIVFGMGNAIAATVAIFLGIITVFVTVGFIGKTQSAANYQTLFAGVGLFPWYLGLAESVTYVVAAILCMTVVLWVRLWAVSRKFLQSFKKVLTRDASVPQKMREDIWQYFNRVLLTTPVCIAALAAVVVFLFF